MRKVIWLMVLLTGLWSALWWAASTGLEQAIATASQKATQQGWDISFGGDDVGGFPTTFEKTFSDIRAVAPDGTTVLADSAILRAPSYWPFDMTLSLPQTPVEVAIADQITFFQIDQGRAKVQLQAGLAGELAAAQLVGGPWQLNTSQGNLMVAEGLTLSLTRVPQTQAAYDLSLKISDPVPGDVVRSALRLSDGWPLTVDRLFAKATLGFDRPLNRYLSNENPPVIRKLELHDVQFVWGDIGFSANGTVSLDEQDRPEGDLQVVVQNWPLWVDLADNARLLPTNRRPQIETVLRALANLDGDTDALDLTLRFEEGQMALGPIHLGPAPILRTQ